MIRQQSIEWVTSTKFLGVLIDYRLNWKSHIQYITNKISKTCGILYQIRETLTEEAR